MLKAKGFTEAGMDPKVPHCIFQGHLLVATVLSAGKCKIPSNFLKRDARQSLGGF